MPKSALKQCPDALEYDTSGLNREERQSAVDLALEAAHKRNLILDSRIHALLQRYIDGEFADAEIGAEIKRPYLN